MKLATAALLAAASVLGACANRQVDAADNAAALGDIRSGRSGDEVVVEGTVERVYPTLRGPGGEHELFLIYMRESSTGMRITVAHNIAVARPAPLRTGDRVTVKGVLELDPSGPVIHWTHHDPRFRHQPGYIEVGGKLYD